MGLIAQHIRAPHAVFILSVAEEESVPTGIVGGDLLGEEHRAVVLPRLQRVAAFCKFIRLRGREDEDLVLTVAVEVGIGERLFIDRIDLGKALYPVRAVVNLRVAPREVQPAFPIGTVGVGVILGRDMPPADARLVLRIDLKLIGPAAIRLKAGGLRVVEPVIIGQVVGRRVDLQTEVRVAVKVVVAGHKPAVRHPAVRVAVRTPDVVADVGGAQLLLSAVVPQKVDAAHAAVILAVLTAIEPQRRRPALAEGERLLVQQHIVRVQDGPFIVRGGLPGDRLRRLVGQRRVRNILFAAGGERQRERRGKQQRGKLCFHGVPPQAMLLIYIITCLCGKVVTKGLQKRERRGALFRGAGFTSSRPRADP